MIGKSLVVALISFGFLTVSIASPSNNTYTSSSTNFKPTLNELHTADQWLRGYQLSLFESLRYAACPGMYICDCIHTAAGRAVIGSSHYYQVYERLCIAVDDYPDPS